MITSFGDEDRMPGIYYEVFDVSHISSEISALSCERLTFDNMQSI